MKLRKLARLCEHDRLEPHVCPICGGTGYSSGSVSLAFGVTNQPCSCDVPRCPGGVFLPDDTLIIEKENGDWPGWAQIAGWSLDYLDALAAAQAK